MMRSFLFLFLFVVCCAGGCRQSDIRTMELNIPSLTAENASQIVTYLCKVSGITAQSIKADIGKKTVYITYDSMNLARKNAELILVENGIEVNGIKPPVK